jgi:hypothetical protein
VLAFGLLISLGIALFASPLASEWPDGLEKVAAQLGFQERAADTPLVPSPLIDYAVRGISSAAWATAVAGALGTGLVFLLALGVARLVVARKRQGRGPDPPSR